MALSVNFVGIGLFLMGILFGFVGLLLAAPLTVVAIPLFEQLYVEGYVEDRRELRPAKRNLLRSLSSHQVMCD